MNYGGYQRNRDPFGADVPYGGAAPDGDDIAQALAVLEAAHPGALEAYKRTIAATAGHMPPLPQAMRFGQQQRDPQIAVWPTTVIRPNPQIYPATTTRLRTLHLSSTTTTAITGQIQFPEWLTIYAISADVHVTSVEPPIDDWNRHHAVVEFTRDSGDMLAQAAPLSNIAGTGENPMPLGGHGWAFSPNQQLVVNGQAAYQNYDVWITFHCIESIALTNQGMVSDYPTGAAR